MFKVYYKSQQKNFSRERTITLTFIQLSTSVSQPEQCRLSGRSDDREKAFDLLGPIFGRRWWRLEVEEVEAQRRFSCVPRAHQSWEQARGRRAAARTSSAVVVLLLASASFHVLFWLIS